MPNRQDLTNLVSTYVVEFVDCVAASDSADAITLEANIQSRLPFLRSASTIALEDLLLDGFKLAQEVWGDHFVEDDENAELFRAVEAIQDERRHAEGQRQEGMQQSQLPLFRKRRPPEED